MYLIWKFIVGCEDTFRVQVFLKNVKIGSFLWFCRKGILYLIDSVNKGIVGEVSTTQLHQRMIVEGNKCICVDIIRYDIP